MARADGSLRSRPARLSRIDVLVIDDWAMSSLSEPERRDFWEICEDRYQVRSTILTSQLPVSRWHEQIGDPTLADGILDRLVHNADRIEMKGDSMLQESPKGKLVRVNNGTWYRSTSSGLLKSPAARLPSHRLLLHAICAFTFAWRSVGLSFMA